MDMLTDIPPELFDDEIICFLAWRYHTTPRDVIRAFLLQEGIIPPSAGDMSIFRLEDNEMEMLRDLTQVVK